MIFSPDSHAHSTHAAPVLQIPKRVKKSRSMAMAGGLVILDWLFMAVCGLGLGLALVALSVLTALF